MVVVVLLESTQFVPQVGVQELELAAQVADTTTLLEVTAQVMVLAVAGVTVEQQTKALAALVHQA